MRTHYLQHVPFEGLGSIEPWLASAGHEITCTRLFEVADLPDPDAIDCLVILGGPMSVNDEAEYPWLASEKRFIREVICSGKPVLGICLGAQLIASALGARVSRNREKEIGWFPVRAVAAADAAVFPFPPSQTVFHWHGETFDLPPGAVKLAKSAACENQAFQFGKSVIGLQFHLETTPESARAIIAHCGDELVPSTYVQTADEMLSADAERYRAINDVMAGVLDFLMRSRHR
jgi:GMP synthase-like glutamine amidotransferase